MLPDHADAWHLCGVACYQRGETEEAQRHIRGAIALRPDHRDYHSNLGLVLKADNRYEEAIEAFSIALSLDPEFTDGLNNLGGTYIAAGRTSDAEGTFRRLLKIDPDNAEGCNNLAVLLASQSRYEEARPLYERALRIRPDYVDAHLNFARMLALCDQFEVAVEHFQAAAELSQSNVAIRRELGETLQKAGELREALQSCELALAMAPDDPDCHVSVGNVHQGMGRMESAESCYRHALVLDPTNARASSNLGTIFMRNDEMDDAIECFSAAIEQDPEFAEAVFNKGSALQKTGKLKEAAKYFLRAIVLNPRIQAAYRYLAEIYRVSGMFDEQVVVLRQWLEQFPDAPAARHLLAAAGGEDVPLRASDEFIREEFDDFADTFEETLAGLHYETPKLIGDLLRRYFAADQTKFDVLDAGCGTGLCGPELRLLGGSLTGVDLSQKMIDKAAAGGSYDDLVVAELTEFMTGRAAQYDLIVSADTLVYFGDLERVLQAANTALKPGGHIVFSVELLNGEGGNDFTLTSSGRFAHSHKYVRRTMDEAGFGIVACNTVVLRTEMQKPVEGLLVCGRATIAD